MSNKRGEDAEKGEKSSPIPTTIETNLDSSTPVDEPIFSSGHLSGNQIQPTAAEKREKQREEKELLRKQQFLLRKQQNDIKRREFLARKEAMKAMKVEEPLPEEGTYEAKVLQLQKKHSMPVDMPAITEHNSVSEVQSCPPRSDSNDSRNKLQASIASNKSAQSYRMTQTPKHSRVSSTMKVENRTSANAKLTSKRSNDAIFEAQPSGGVFQKSGRKAGKKQRVRDQDDETPTGALPMVVIDGSSSPLRQRGEGDQDVGLTKSMDEQDAANDQSKNVIKQDISTKKKIEQRPETFDLIDSSDQPISLIDHLMATQESGHQWFETRESMEGMEDVVSDLDKLKVNSNVLTGPENPKEIMRVEQDAAAVDAQKEEVKTQQDAPTTTQVAAPVNIPTPAVVSLEAQMVQFEAEDVDDSMNNSRVQSGYADVQPYQQKISLDRMPPTNSLAQSQKSMHGNKKNNRMSRMTDTGPTFGGKMREPAKTITSLSNLSSSSRSTNRMSMAIGVDGGARFNRPVVPTMEEDQISTFLESASGMNDSDDDDATSDARNVTNLHPKKGIYGNRFSMVQNVPNSLALSTASLGSNLNSLLDQYESDDDDDDEDDDV